MHNGERLKLFFLSYQMLSRELLEVEQAHGIDLSITLKQDAIEPPDPLYLQFAADDRIEAATMARHYELFYCIENSLRRLVTDQLFAKHGDGWWDALVPPTVRDNVGRNVAREREAGVTLRSADLIDYTTFGELGEIIQANWDSFSDTFSDRKALQKVVTGLNLLRGPIAHCSPLAEDEVLRLRLGLRDLFRLMS